MNEALTTIMMARSELKSSINEIRENAAYVIVELETLETSTASRLRTEETFNYLYSFFAEVTLSLKRFETGLGKFLDTPNTELAQAVEEPITSIDFNLPLVALHELVGYLNKEPDILYILVAETATNILKAEGVFVSSRAKILDAIKSTSKKIGNWLGAVDCLSLPCNRCGHDDCMSFCVVRSDHPFYSISEESGTSTIAINHGESLVRLSSEQLEPMRTAVLDRDIKPLLELLETYLPFCSSCSQAFCQEHWTNFQDVFDDGFYDCTYADCPNGHRNMIDD